MKNRKNKKENKRNLTMKANVKERKEEQLRKWIRKKKI